MQQQIGFCTTTDGAHIAYATVGAGPAVVVAWYAPSHLGLEWEKPRVRDFWTTIGRRHLVVRYDKYGCGLSDRKRTDFSLDCEVRTIDAILKKLGLKSMVLWGQGWQGGTAAISYASKFPDRVSRLILSNPDVGARGGPAAWGGASPDSLRGLMLSNWRMAAVTLAETMLGSVPDASALKRYSRVFQEGAAPEMLDQLNGALSKMDLRDLLHRLSMPTLVVHYRNNRVIPFETGLEVAAGIPGARFVPLEGDANFFFFNDTRPLLRAIAEFLDDPIEVGEALRSDSYKSPAAPEAGQGVFRREGEFWTIACQGEVFRLKHRMPPPMNWRCSPRFSGRFRPLASRCL
jgi:pimeloyl-ACP methyl ester carboxylesterase